MPNATELLTQLGLNELEAAIYVHLLQHEPVTAYRVGQALGKQTANVYKAVEVLARRGAVVIEEGETRLCRAVPVKEFLRHTERDFLATTRAAAEQLGKLHQPTFDERVYRIESPAQVFEQAATMLAGADSVAIVDAFPAALRQIRAAVEKAIRRGVKAYVQVYEPTDLPGAILVHPGRSAESLAHWQSEQLNVVADGRQCLLALLSPTLDVVHQAMWSRSLYLSSILHSGLTAEHTLHRLMHARGATATQKVLGEHRFFLHDEVPGARELMSRFQPKKAKKKK
ncbi:MAG TPA: helix-turn-helix domain-containing protein [Thermoanaerobaculia bacterium]|nr:helix-turn-helix domain-containing protein [Thermoanaerobaculia bacterium]